MMPKWVAASSPPQDYVERTVLLPDGKTWRAYYEPNGQGMWINRAGRVIEPTHWLDFQLPPPPAS